MPTAPPISSALKSPSLEPTKGVAVTLQSSYLGCFAHAGFMNALLDAGIRPAKISGSSSGAIIASAYAAGLEGDGLKDFILNPRFQRSFFEWRALMRGGAVFAFYQRQGLLRGHRAVKYLRESIPVKRIEDARLAELSIGVTNLTHQKRQLITRGEIAPFIVASCAIPPVIAAQEIEGELYLDGGFTDESPFEQWIENDEIDTIIIHQIESPDPGAKLYSKKTNFISCWSAMHSAAADEFFEARVARAKAAGKRVVIHRTKCPRPKLVASAKLALSNYNLAYEQGGQLPEISKSMIQ